MKHPVPYVDHDVRRSRHVASEVPRCRVVMIRRIEEPVVLRLSELCHIRSRLDRTARTLKNWYDSPCTFP